ncbi:MAG: P1 family peptidase, partial [Myxococcota bacterium]
LVQSNFGHMHNMTVDGAVVGRDLDPLYPMEGRRRKIYGSIIVVLATDAPLLPSQLDRLSKRAALGLGRVGSYASSTSGEIVFAFSTGNRTPRERKGTARMLNMSFIVDERIDNLYEGVIEATEEAVLNAVFCSSGMSGREGRYAPPLPTQELLRRLRGATDSEIRMLKGA